MRVRPARIARILGIPVDADAIAAVFTRLQLPFTRDGGNFIVTPPSRRFDLAIEEDFVEEVARIHGYDAIPATASAHVQQMLPLPEARRSRHALMRRLAALGWQEVVTFGFVSSAIEKAIDPAADPIRVLNPIAAQLDVMRTSLLPGLLEVLATNVNRKAPRACIFEVGRTFRRAPPGHDQPLRVGGLAYGGATPEQWGVARRDVDFFDVKGDLAALAAPRVLTTVRLAHPALHPGRSAQILLDGGPAGWLGELHPRLVRKLDLPKAPIAFEVDLTQLEQAMVPSGKPVSRTPVVRRDLALVVDEALPVQELLDALNAAKPPHVIAVAPFDVYHGHGLPSGKKSLAILVLMQDTSRTLTDADIDATERELLAVAKNRVGAALRQ